MSSSPPHPPPPSRPPVAALITAFDLFRINFAAANGHYRRRIAGRNLICAANPQNLPNYANAPATFSAAAAAVTKLGEWAWEGGELT